MIRTLLFSTLYPSSARPIHGVFVETRLRELLKSGQVETRVVAPVPWFPFTGARFGDYAKFSATPRSEVLNGIKVYHPRYFLPPKIGMNIAPYVLAAGALQTVRKLIDEGFDFDLIDAHYYYPDGVAAGLLAKWLGKPFVVTARGSDVNLIGKYRIPKRLMLRAANRASASLGVSKALTASLAEMGADKNKLFVFRNGVDLEKFRPEGQEAARRKLGLGRGKIVFSVGNLVEVKGHDIAIRALSSLPTDSSLILAGDGADKEKLSALARSLGLDCRVRFVGQIANSELKWWYSAADVLVLCSSREGWPNVLLEAMACGTPVIATDVGGTREIVRDPIAGALLPERTPQALAEACKELFGKPRDPAAVRRYAEDFSWAATTRAQVELFSDIIKSCATYS